MSDWRIEYHRQAQKDARNLVAAGLRDKADAIIDVLRRDPFESPAPFERLSGELAGAYSRRINIQHRLVYLILPDAMVVRVLRMWTHYGD